MFSHRRKLLPLCIAASLLSGFGLKAAAIGVGEIHLQSYLGKPLVAEIPLSHLGDLDATQLKVQLGAQDDYTAMGVEYLYQHSQLKIEPIIKNGEGYVRISTREPITEPYLNFVLSLRWPQGQLVREFTVLLDPPTQLAVAAAAPATQPEPMTESAIEPASHHRQHHHAAVEHTPTTAAAAPSGNSYTIRRGDSLWRIANKMRSGHEPVEQVMAAIRTLNPSAFINGNPNLLKEATTITLPDSERIAAADSNTNVGTASAVAEKKATASVSAKDNAVAKENSVAVEQLSDENSALKSQVADLTGNVATLNQNLVQSEQRLHQLESQLNELLQQMQQQRATIATLSGNVDTHAAPIAQAGSMINQVNAAELQSAPRAHTPWWVHLLYWLGIGGAVTWAIREHFWPQRRLAAATIGGAVVPDYENKPTPVTRAATSINTSNASISIGNAAMNKGNTPATIGVPINIKAVEDASELSLDLDDLPSAIAPAAVVNDEPAPQLLKSSDEPVDASISAGVFVAFGRFSEAERLLREALVYEPARIDLKLQLLDVLMQSDQPGAFDDLAAEIEHEASTPETLAELAILRDSYRPRH